MGQSETQPKLASPEIASDYFGDLRRQVQELQERTPAILTSKPGISVDELYSMFLAANYAEPAARTAIWDGLAAGEIIRGAHNQLFAGNSLGL